MSSGVFPSCNCRSRWPKEAFTGLGRLAQGERSPAFREFINAAGLEMKSVDEQKECIGARGEDGESHG